MYRLNVIFLLLITLLTMTSCRKNQEQHQLNRDEFMSYHGPFGTDYTPMQDDPSQKALSFSDMPVKQAKESPGDPGSSIPGIDKFRDPSNFEGLASVFKLVHFPYNSHLVKGTENLQTLKSIANYLKSHKDTYVFVAGHCDERGAEAFNLSLGARRSNAVRGLLVHEGVDPNQVFTISYGKERPLVLGHDEEAWAENRRAEFKIYKN